MTFSELYRTVVELFYPPVCCACDALLMRGENIICLNCLERLPRTRYHLEPSNPMEQRFWGKADITNASSFYFFNKGSDFQKILHKLKYHQGKDIGYILGKYAGAELLDSSNFQSFDYIVPVPLHPNKLKKRGYNQSESIGLGLSEIMKKPMETENLCRVIENPTQTNKSVYQRWENTHGIFDIKDPELYQNKHLLLVDDVLTTGSTLIACAEAIHAKCNARISIFTLAIA